MTAKAAVVGWPIEHSLSPVLHGYWLKQYGIDGSYERIAIEPGTFPQRIAELRAAGYRGVNVTVPFKEEAFALADSHDGAAKAAGAVNLLVLHPARFEGRNTDTFGLSASLEAVLGPGALVGRRAVLLGAGGAARGAVLALDSLGASEVHILNRGPARAESLAGALAAQVRARLVAGGLERWKDSAGDAALLVNSSSAGMKGNPPLDIDLGALPKSAAVCDIVYNPLETALLKDAAARGHRTIDGLGMLMHQAAPSFEAFFAKEMKGRRAEVTPELRAELVEALEARG